MSHTTPTVVSPESVGMSSERLRRVDELVARHIDSNAYQGNVVLVARHGQICHFAAAGKADDGVAMTTDAIFRLASMSKVPAAVAVLQLWERGLISLADPISTYLPEFANPQVAVCASDGTYELRNASREITIHHLLSMTGGMTNTWWDGAFEHPAYQVVPKLYAEAGVRDDMNAPDLTLEENIKRVATTPLIADPGEMFDYSNSSVDTLCRVVEVVSGKSFDEYQRVHILQPLGMDETWFFIPEEHRSRLAEVYWPGRDEKQTANVAVGPLTLGPEGAHSQHHTYFSGAAGLHGTTHDYFKFAQMLLNKGEFGGERILSPAAVELMTSNQITAQQKAGTSFLGDHGWGFGVSVLTGHGDGASTPGRFGWDGGFGTSWYSDPQAGLVGVLMTQVLASPARIDLDFWDTVYGSKAD